MIQILHSDRQRDVPPRTWMAIFFVTALLVYAPGIWWGLPDGTAPGRHRPWGTDELGPVGAINELYGVFAAHHPTFNPQYPLFHYFCQFVFVAPYYSFLWATGHLSYPAPNFPYGLDHPTIELRVMTLLARLVSLLMAAGVVAVAFRTGEVLRGRRAGLLAALLVLLEYPMFFYARTSNVDMGALFWTALGLWVFARCMTDRLTMQRGIALGVCASLATASKDASYAVFLPLGGIVLYLHWRAARREGQGWRQAWGVPVRALATAIVVYVAGSGLLFRPSRYLQHLRFVTSGAGGGVYYFRNPPTLAGYLTLSREVAEQLIGAMGLPMLLCALVGAGIWARDTRLRLWLIPAAGVVVGVIIPVRFVLLRLVMLTVYMLAFCAADVLTRWSTQSRRAPRVAGQIALLIVAVWSGLRGADLTYQMLDDARYAAAVWFGASLHSGDRLGIFGAASNLPHLSSDVRTELLLPPWAASLTTPDGPEFIVSMPLNEFETTHELVLPEPVYRQLLDGSLGYRQAALIQGPSLFRGHPPFVNPPVRIFMRKDVWAARLANP